MSHLFQRLWTLDDYRRFLQHPEPLIRGWAADRIEIQYPRQAAESLVGLLADPDRHLQISAIRAIGDSGDPRYEPALLAVFPHSQGYGRNWLTSVLGQFRCPTLLPELVAQLQAAPPRSPAAEIEMLALRSVIEALGYYPDQAARLALWQFLERYRQDDRLAYTAVQGLLHQPGPATLARLAPLYSHLEPGGQGWWDTSLALAEPVGLDRLTQEVSSLLADDPDEALFLIDDWLQHEIPYSEIFEEAYDRAAGQRLAGLLPQVLAEFERAAAARGDDLSAWPAGRPAGSYRWRMGYTHQVLRLLAGQPPKQRPRYRQAVALGLALLAQALIDQNDEAQLQTASNELIRQAVLLSILGSPRPNVLPDVVSQVAALGPGIVPHLVELLQGEHFWAWPRALQVITALAQADPGPVEATIPAMLNLIDDTQSDYVLEPIETALVAIGPAVIAPAAAGLGQVDYVYDIYVGSALANIPTLASAEALLHYLADQAEIQEYEVEVLVDLGHAAAIPFLRDRFDWQDDLLLCPALYKLALLNDYTGPELVHWRAVAIADYTKFMAHTDPLKPPPPPAAPEPKPQPPRWTLAQAKRQEKKKKKRR
jgi:hypothetical protein